VIKTEETRVLARHKKYELVINAEFDGRPRRKKTEEEQARKGKPSCPSGLGDRE